MVNCKYCDDEKKNGSKWKICEKCGHLKVYHEMFVKHAGMDVCKQFKPKKQEGI